MKQAISTTGPPRPDVWAAWQHELSSQRDAKLATDLQQCERALFPRFNDYYRRLHALPRRWRRGIGRRLRQSLAGIALLLALGHGAAFAATINIDGTVCTLIDAITAANTDTATSGCDAGSGADTLVLPAGSTTTLTAVDNDTGGPNGLPVTTSEITIEGNGSTIERSTVPGTPEFRILKVERPNGDLTLRNATITGGIATRSVSGSGHGGGIDSTGNLTIIQSTISGNSAWRAGGIRSAALGAFLGSLTIVESTISGNSATSAGGGIGGIGTISDSTISNNSSGQRGGGLWGSGNISKSTFSGNYAADGGGGIFQGGGLPTRGTISDTTITGNSTGGGGGGIYSNNVTVIGSTVSGNIAAANGGGLYGSGTVDNSTISGNSASSGGGIATQGTRGSEFTVQNSTISGNMATQLGGGLLVKYGHYVYEHDNWPCGGGNVWECHYYYDSSIVVGDSIISGNRSPQGAEIATLSNLNGYASGFIESSGDNLLGDSAQTNAEAFSEYLPGDILFDPTDIIATNDGTNPTPLSEILDLDLAFNGGPTQTHALVEGSPAIDAAGVDCPPPATDQRGITRPQGAACDIGAFEGWVGNVNDLVTFDVDPSSAQSTRDATGCPPGYAGRYRFTAALANVSGLDLNSLSSNIDTLTGGNLVLAPDGGLLGVGDKLPVAREGDYADGTLSPGETAETPFEICLKKWRSFQFFVDAYGSAVTD